jgi:CBS domain-containing protein
MQFSLDGEWEQVVRITGPAHNLLGLRIGRASSEPAIETLGGDEDAGVISRDDVVRQVLQGVADANLEAGSGYGVEAIRYVVTDTPSPTVYRFLAKALIDKRIKSEE